MEHDKKVITSCLGVIGTDTVLHFRLCVLELFKVAFIKVPGAGRFTCDCGRQSKCTHTAVKSNSAMVLFKF